MKRNLTWLIMLFSLSLFAQIDTYKAEENGYYTRLMPSAYGIVATDNYSSKIYLISDGKSKEIFTSAGCGRYYSVSPNKKKIGFKLINKNKTQTPVILSIKDGKIEKLHKKTSLCGQVSFSDNDEIAFTVGKELFVKKEKDLKSYNLGTYANIAPISPNGKFVAFNDRNDQIWILNLKTKQKQKISDEKTGYAYPKWSPDSEKLLYQSLGSDLKVWNLEKEKNYSISKGGNPNWSPCSEFIIFEKIERDNFEFKGSELYLCHFDGTEIEALTSTKSENEMGGVFDGKNKIIYHNYQKKNIFSKEINLKKKEKSESKTILKSNSELEIKFYNFSNEESVKEDATKYIQGVPYVHQVYDTPDFHDGKGSCAPTDAIMAIAYYNLLPPWKITIHTKEDTHTNNYGAYIADKYHFNEIFYNTHTTPYGTESWGGYSYMWADGSPSSKMRSYIQNHKLDAQQSWTSQCSYAKTATEIDNGYPHSICSWITTSGHLTLAIGYIDPQRTLIFNDPYGNKNTPNYPSYDGQDARYDWPGYNNGYQNLDATGTHGGIAWTVTSRAELPTYNDTIIDDTYYNRGFYIHNQPPAHMQYFRDRNTGFNEHFWWTKSVTNENVCYVKWSPQLTAEKNYDVYAFIPSGSYANAENACYKISSKNGTSEVIINQSNYGDEWVFLGSYPFAPAEASVYLGDSTGIAGEYLAFDAMKWEQSPISGFNAINTKIKLDESVQFVNYTKNENATYEWTFQGGIPETSTEKNPLIKYEIDGIYKVELKVTINGTSETFTKEDFIHVKADYTSIDNFIGENFDLKINPNPIKSEAIINYNLENSSRVYINLYNLYGKKVRTLLNKQKEKGNHQINFYKNGLSTGIYFLKFSTINNSKTIKIIIL